VAIITIANARVMTIAAISQSNSLFRHQKLIMLTAPLPPNM
jgi:hypothetical protein